MNRQFIYGNISLFCLLYVNWQAGAKVNGIGNPLAFAARKGLTEAIKCLLEAGANPNTPDMVSLRSSLSHHTITESCLTGNSSG